jgi:hypothetical protein
MKKTGNCTLGLAMVNIIFKIMRKFYSLFPLLVRLQPVPYRPNVQWTLYVGHFKSSAHYVFSLKMNLFYRIHLQAFSVISIVLYHSGPTFGKVLYSCLDAFIVDAYDYSGHLIRHLLSASEAYPTEWLLQFWEQVTVRWARPTRLWTSSAENRAGEHFWGHVPKLRIIVGKFFHTWQTRVYQHHISDYSSNI